MPSFLVPLCIGVVAALLAQLFRQYKIKNIKLSPNCLLTKYPLIYIKKIKLSNLLTSPKEQIFLQAHGYETLMLSHHSGYKSLHSQIQKLQRLYTKAHIFYDPETLAEMKNLTPAETQFFASQQQTLEKPLPEHLKYAICLAEKDFQCSH